MTTNVTIDAKWISDSEGNEQERSQYSLNSEKKYRTRIIFDQIALSENEDEFQLFNSLVL